jgi:hypothetical protein
VVPFRRFYPVAEGVGRDGTPVGQACTGCQPYPMKDLHLLMIVA